MQGFFSICKSGCYTIHIIKLNKNHHMMTSIDAKKLLTKFNTHLWLKKNKLQKVGTEGIYLSIIKAIYNKPIANIIINGEKLKAPPLKSEIRQWHPLSPILFNIVLEVPAMAIRTNERNPNWERSSETVTVHRLDYT